ncbi:MAG: hypothetical protein KIT54_04625 [Phycisphaeraceae bacterium]|nr:hypothetical protein [Phycisphaeraceae bacterium]
MFKKTIGRLSNRKLNQYFDSYVARLTTVKDEEMSNMLGLGFGARMHLLQATEFPQALLDVRGAASDDEVMKAWAYLRSIHVLGQQFGADGTRSGLYMATGLEVWLYTFRALLAPEMFVRGVDVWRQLSRGAPFLEDQLKRGGLPNVEIVYPHRFVSEL